MTVDTTADGYAELLAWAARRAPGTRLLWAVEGCRSRGPGLRRVLLAAGQQVVEAGRPQRATRRPGGKSDPADALLAARAALAAKHHALPRGDGDREALRILLVAREHANTTRTVAVNVFSPRPAAPATAAPVHATADRGLRQAARPRRSANRRAVCRQTLRSLAERIRLLDKQIRANERQLHDHVAAMMPALLDEPGVGPVCAAHLIVAWSHPGRCRSEAAFAALAGVSPLEASSGRVKAAPAQPIR